MNNRINVSEVIESQAASGFLFSLLALVAAASFLEGFDAQIQGYTAPMITKLWHIKRADFTPVFVFFSLGIMLGAIVLGNLGDIFGRRIMIIGGVLLFGVFTVAGVFCGDVTSLSATRFFSAFFLGGAAPNAIALVIDYSPHRRRGLNVGIMYTLYTTGGAGGGFLSAWLLPHYGWHSVYWVSGCLAVIFSGVLAMFLPESVRYMIVRHKHRAALAATMHRLSPHLAIDSGTQFFMQKATERQPWVGELFAQGRGVMTVALWMAYGLGLMGLIFVTSWMPTVFADSGISISRSVIATSIYQGGGAVGSVLFGWMLDRKHGILRLAGLCLLAVPIIIGIGHATFLPVLLLVLAFLAGVCIVGTQTGLNALSGGLYPTYLRSTGAGWTSGVGRIGAIIGPILGGVLIGLHLSLAMIFTIVAIPSFCAALCLVAVNYFRPAESAGNEPVVEPNLALQ